MKKIFMLALAAVIMAAPAEAKKKKNSAAPVKSEVRTPATKGLFNVQFHKDKYYFQIPDSLLGRLLMACISMLKKNKLCVKNANG